MSRLTLTSAPTLLQMYELSRKLFSSGVIDNKKQRADLDIVSGKITVRNNMEYNRSKRIWEQSGREVKIIVEVSSKPISYEKNDTINIHRFPVTFLIKSVELGLNSPFKYRSGSEKKPLLYTKGKSSTEIANINITKQIDLHFFFHLMVVLKQAGILFGRDTTNGKSPTKTNPTGASYFEKHSFFVFEKVLIPFFRFQKNLSIGKSV